MRKYLKKVRSLLWLSIYTTKKLNQNIRYSYRTMVIPLVIKKRIKNGILAVDIRNVHGLGSKLTWLLLLLDYCEKRKLKLAVRFSYPKVKQDFFQHFFLLQGINNNAIVKNKLKFTAISSIVEVAPGAGNDRKITLEDAYKLVSKHITIHPQITAIVEQYAQEYMKGDKILGLHYRGTDKGGEAKSIEYHKVYSNIMLYVNKYGIPDKLFLSTDSAEFLTYILNIGLPFPIIFRDKDTRSTNQKAVHLDMNSFQRVKLINEEALINCLLLSKCSFLLKSSSFLSDWSKLFNPLLKVTVLNKPYDWALWFPGRALIENNAFEPI